MCWKGILLPLILLENVELPARTQMSWGYENSGVLMGIFSLVREIDVQTNVFSS